MSALPRALLDDLSGAGEVIADPDRLASYRRDQSPAALTAAGTPVAVVRPSTAAQVQAAMRAAAAHGVAVVPRGAGSGLSGGANATDGCLVVCLERMARIVDVDVGSLTATVEPGALTGRLRAAAAEAGLLYAPDPASIEFSSIGGNIATNAGGLCCVKYGVTRDSLLEVEVVLADGDVVRMGHRTRKGVTGYDLASLMCGSEGTLGVITQATVRLPPAPPPSHTLAASFPRLDAAADAVREICRRHRPSMLEIMDRATIAAVEAVEPMELDLEAEAMIFARSDAGRVAGAEEIGAMAAICERAGASLVATTDEEAEGRMLLAARRLAYTALERSADTLLDDVAVPLGAVPVLIRGVTEIARTLALRIAVFGHAGDGNMHPTILFDRKDADELARARDAFDAIIALACSVGGTSTGEHGVGSLKLAHAREELGSALPLMQAIKGVFDPTGRMNPGKGV